MDINYENFTKPQYKPDFLTIKSYIAALKGNAEKSWNEVKYNKDMVFKALKYYENIYRYMDYIVHTNHQGFHYTDAIPEDLQKDKNAVIKCAINFMQFPPDDTNIRKETKTQLNDYGDALMKMGKGQDYTLPDKPTRAKK